MSTPVGNEPGSYFGIIHGPFGLYALPTAFAIIILIVIFAMMANSAVNFPGQGYKSPHPIRSIR